MSDAAFFDAVRGHFGPLKQGQVDGLNLFLGEARRRRLPAETVAYILATAWHETARTMQPVRETLAGTDEEAIRRLDNAWSDGRLSWVRAPYWRRGADGKAWFGRGYVQITHRENYAVMGQIVGADLEGNPSAALDPRIALQIIFEGMLRGTFTRLPLGAFVRPGEVVDFVGARKVVNGTDRAREIAAHAEGFLAALRTIDLLDQSRTVAAASEAKKDSLWGTVSGAGALVLTTAEEHLDALTDAIGTVAGPVQAAEMGAKLATFLPIGAGVLAAVTLLLFIRQRRRAARVEAIRRADQQKAGT